MAANQDSAALLCLVSIGLFLRCLGGVTVVVGLVGRIVCVGVELI
jgi:hypothetical protein